MRNRKAEFRIQNSESRRKKETWIVFFFCLIMPAGSLVAEAGERAASETNLADTLMRTRKSVEDFWSSFRSVTCVESVTQEKFGKADKLEYTLRNTYDYLVLLNVEKDGLSVEESRIQQGKKGKEKGIPLVVANGLSTLLLAFHPYYRDDFQYQLESSGPADERELTKIRFKHIPGTQSTTALRLRGKDYPLEIQGTAWVDPGSGAIHRITAGIAAPVSDLNLKSLEMDVSYAPQDFKSKEGIYWLPSTAAIEIRTERQRWRNLHRYSGYKRFTVNTEDTISGHGE